MPTAAFITFGCKVNQYDSQAMREILKERGYAVVPPSQDADLYIVNTCTVTHHGDAEARRAIRKVHRLRPDAKIFVTGCYADSGVDELLGIEGVSKVFGNKEKANLSEHLRDIERKQTVEWKVLGDADVPVDLGEFGLSVASFDERTRALLKVQDGCSAFCSYCIIPYVRGKMRSRALPEIVEEARRLADNGFRELVVTGVHLGAYGRDIRRRWNLVDVLEALHEVEGITRIRLSSIEPMDVPPSLIRTMASLKKCARHFHIPLQSGSTPILKRMRRRYTQNRFLELVSMLYEAMPDVGLSTDIMVGFPGETDEDFMETCYVTEKSGFHRLHVFRYSPREGTPAATYPDQVPPDVAIARSDTVRQIGQRLTLRFQRSSLGTVAEVMIESSREGERNELAGYTGNYLRILTNAAEAHVGTLQPVRLTGIEDGFLRGELLLEPSGNSVRDEMPCEPRKSDCELCEKAKGVSWKL